MSPHSDKPLSVPGWADFFDIGQYAAFLSALDDELQRRGWSYVLDDATVLVSGAPGIPGLISLGTDTALGVLAAEAEGGSPDGDTLPADEAGAAGEDEAGEPGRRLGLVDLAKKCLHRRQEPESWPRVMREHFDSLSRSEQEIDALTGMDFERARPLLRVRLYPSELAAAGRDRLVSRPAARGLEEVLVADLPSVVVTVRPEVAARWQLSREQLFEIGRANLRSTIPEHQRVTLDEGVVIDIYQGEDHFVASHALLVRPGQERGAPFGMLVVVPNRHSMATHTIRSLRSQTAAAQVLLGWAVRAHRDGPGAISPHLYWISWDGRLERFMVQPAADGKLRVTPPERFVEQVMVPLSGRGAQPN